MLDQFVTVKEQPFLSSSLQMEMQIFKDNRIFISRQSNLETLKTAKSLSPKKSLLDVTPAKATPSILEQLQDAIKLQLLDKR